MTKLVELARAIADGLGDNFDHAFANKSEWNAARGEKGGRYRDINEPRQDGYLDAARAVIACLMDVTPGMEWSGDDVLSERGCNPLEGDAKATFAAMLQHVLDEGDK